MGFCNCSMFCCALLCVYSSFAIILTGCFALFVFLVSHDSYVALPCDATALTEFVIAVFPDHTHLLF